LVKRSVVWAQAIAVILFVASAAQAQKDPTVTESARKHFKAGVAYIEDPSGAKYEEALQEFRRAYAESPTPKIMNNIGFCALSLERDGEAIEAYEIYLAGNSSDLTPAIRKQVEKDVAMLKSSLVKVQLTVQPVDASVVDERRNSKGELVVNRYKLAGGGAALGLHPGHHKVTVSAPGLKTAEWEFDAEPATSHKHDFALVAEGGEPTVTSAKPEATKATVNVAEPPRAPEKGVHTGVYVGGIAAGVFAAAATVTGVMAMSKQSDFDKAKKDGNVSKMDSLEKSGNRLALITDIGIGAAVISAGVATYFYFSSSSKPAEKVASPVALRIDPVVNVDRAGLALSGSF
jgi:hypothetical protein